MRRRMTPQARRRKRINGLLTNLDYADSESPLQRLASQ